MKFGDSQYRWIYDVRSSTAWLPSLASNFHSPDIVIFREGFDEQGDQFFWTSPHFNDLATPQEVENRAGVLKAIFDGALYMNGFNGTDMQLGDLHQYPGEIRVNRPQFNDVLVSPFSPKHLAKKIEPLENPSHDPIAQAVFLCRHDDACRAILTMLGVNGITWISLYAVWDTVRDAGWKEAKVAEVTRFSASDIKAFTGTANNYSVIGAMARHGKQGDGRPNKTMTLAQASELMGEVIRAFFKERIKLAATGA